jgi:hypothetical protein
MRLKERLIEMEEMCWKGMKERMGKMVGKGGECSVGSEVLANGGV